MGPKVYDSRIRPAGINGTGTVKRNIMIQRFLFNKTETERGTNIFQDPL